MREFSEEKKHEYWNHFLSWIFLNNIKQLTPRRMKRAKYFLWTNDFFWYDILARHDGQNVTPEQMREKNSNSYCSYCHMIENMEGTVRQELVRLREIEQ